MNIPVSQKRKSASEAASYVGLSRSRLAKFRIGGGGPRYLKLGGRVVYDEADLDAWLNRNKYNSTSEYDR